MIIDLSLFSNVKLFEFKYYFSNFFIMILYFTLLLNIVCSRKQQKLEIKGGLHSLRLDRSLVCDQLWLKIILAQTKKLHICPNLLFKIVII